MTTAARTCLLAGLAALALAAPASASQVLRVEGGRTVVVDDPTVPPRSATDLSVPPAPQGGSRASAARARAAAARRPSVTRVLRRALADRRISRAAYRDYLARYRRARSTVRRLSGARRANLAGS